MTPAPTLYDALTAEVEDTDGRCPITSGLHYNIVHLDTGQGWCEFCGKRTDTAPKKPGQQPRRAARKTTRI